MTFLVESPDLHKISQCLKELSRDDIIEVGLALGLYYSTLKKMQMLPQDMVQAWLLQRDSVAEQPTVDTLVQALEDSNLPGTAKLVETEFKLNL